ncbi:hypothetical protein AB0L53_26870 [Nonomuraea sp. NPDC052129]|uniref:hypothetical protein n=1 Tax=Nonomuraea sp. NPDC052129 TaxID=3154651 RepID=UPI003443AC8D
MIRSRGTRATGPSVFQPPVRLPCATTRSTRSRRSEPQTPSQWEPWLKVTRTAIRKHAITADAGNGKPDKGDGGRQLPEGHNRLNYRKLAFYRLIHLPVLPLY